MSNHDPYSDWGVCITLTVPEVGLFFPLREPRELRSSRPNQHVALSLMAPNWLAENKRNLGQG